MKPFSDFEQYKIEEAADCKGHMRLWIGEFVELDLQYTTGVPMMRKCPVCEEKKELHKFSFRLCPTPSDAAKTGEPVTRIVARLQGPCIDCRGRNARGELTDAEKARLKQAAKAGDA